MKLLGGSLRVIADPTLPENAWYFVKEDKVSDQFKPGIVGVPDLNAIYEQQQRDAELLRKIEEKEREAKLLRELGARESGRTDKDPWAHRAKGMRCQTCMWFVAKVKPKSGILGVKDPEPYDLGRCRRHAPTMNGFPAVFVNDWCGDHKLDEEKL